ncbi:MAG: pyrroline-5-carboxylate reductase [Congregibacter sp.]|nr:pyrroline-5-carboxylate reductase [Congregibacter sp.]MDP5072061.1 pyrroline-5-carboxylate reductase [Congregibacter sp.]
MSEFSTAFIGAGNMSRSIIGGLLASGVKADSISASNPSDGPLEALRNLGLSQLAQDNTTVAKSADVVVLAVKPQRIRGVCEELADTMRDDQLVVSIATGVAAASLHRWLGAKAQVVRCMPNTPALLGAGASGLFAQASVSAANRQRAEQIMRAVGIVRWVDEESLLHAVTAVAGSAPAYFFQFMEAMIDEAQRMGLDEESARTLCANTCIGAGRMLAEGDCDAAELRRRVCSPKGTTERAVASFTAAGLEDVVSEAMQACYARSQEIARELS